MGAIEIWSDPKCAAGSTYLASVSQWVSCWYGDALDNNADCTLIVPNDSAALPSLAIGNVLRLVTDNAAEPVVEYRIRRLDDSILDPTVTIVATPLVQDLADVVVSSIIGGIRRLDVNGSLLTPTQWINTWVLPSLTPYGITYITLGMVTPTAGFSINGGYNLTCLGLLETIVTGTDYRPRLRRNGDTGYFLDLVIPNAAATSPVALVGRNVIALRRQIDGLTQSSVIVPQGRTPTNDTYRQTVSEYGLKVSAVASPLVTVVDPDGNVAGPIYFANQEKNQWLEKMAVPIDVRDEGDGFNGFPSYYTGQQPIGSCFVSTQNEIWVLVSSNSASWINIYNADSLAYVTRLAIATYRANGKIGGIVYDVTNGKVFIAVWDGTNSKVLSYVASTRTLGATIAIGAYSIQFGIRAANGRIYFTTAAANGLKRIDPATDTVAATIATASGCYDAQYAASAVFVLLTTVTAGNVFSKLDPTTDTLTTLAMGASTNGCCWSPSNSRAYVSRSTSNDIKVVDVSGAMSVTATITGITGPSWMFYSATTGYVYCVNTTGTIYTIDPATNLIVTSIPFLPSDGRWGDIEHSVELRVLISGYSVSFPSVGRLYSFYPSTGGAIVRRQVTASTVAGVLTVTPTAYAFVVNDLTQIRDDAAGSWRTELKDYATYALYPPRVSLLDRSDLSGEHNYARNPWMVSSVNSIRADGWDRLVNAQEFASPYLFWSSPDAGTQVSQACTLLNAVITGQNNFFLTGLPVGYVINPGDSFAFTGNSGFCATRVVADGSGQCSIVTMRLAGLAGAGQAAGTAVTIKRPLVTTVQGLLPVSTKCPVLSSQEGGGSVTELGVWANVPYIAGRTTVQFQLSVLIWRINFTPNTMVQFVVYGQNGSTLGTVTPTDTTNFTDFATVQYDFTLQYTLTAPIRAFLAIRRMNGAGAVSGTFLIRDARVVLGPDPMTGIAPFEGNYLKGELYHAGMRKVRDLTAPVIDYTVEVIEDDPNAPFLVGVVTTLQDPDRSLVASPKVVGIRRYLPSDGEGGGLVMPQVTLNNKPTDLTKTLADAGSL